MTAATTRHRRPALPLLVLGMPLAMVVGMAIQVVVVVVVVVVV